MAGALRSAARRARVAIGRPTPALPAARARARGRAAPGFLLARRGLLCLGALEDVVERGVLPPLVVARIVLLDHLAVLDHAAPRARFDLLHLDERLEAVKVGAHRALDV